MHTILPPRGECLTIVLNSIIPPCRLFEPNIVEQPLNLFAGILDVLSEGDALALLKRVLTHRRGFDGVKKEVVTAVLTIDLTPCTPCIQIEQLMADNRIGVAQSIDDEFFMNPLICEQSFKWIRVDHVSENLPRYVSHVPLGS